MAQVSTGLRQGDFSLLRVLSGGNFVDILTLIAQGGGGGGSVQSVSAPLALTNGVLSLGNFTQQDWEDQNGIVRSLQPNATGQLQYQGVMIVDMQVLQQNLANYTQTAALTPLLAGKVDNSRVDCVEWRRGCRSSQAFWCGLPCPRPDAISRARSVPILLKLNSNTAKRSRPE